MNKPTKLRETSSDDFGATHGEEGIVFRVWAPKADQIVLDLVESDQQMPLVKDANSGFHSLTVPVSACGPTPKYFYRVEGGPPRPDPASRSQPEGVHGPSQVVARSFDWTDHDWHCPAREDLIIYECHIGTLTKEGTYQSAIDRLDELAELGVTAIELMPVADAAGRWNWGYDGVCFFAPNAAYGTPDELRQFVDAAHARGLAVILDVVYNHLGPEGNYLAEFGPYLSEKHNTIWGDAPNFDDSVHGESARAFVIASALVWLDEYHFDGLRVDAIHCMRDDSEPHIAIDISIAIRNWSQRTGRRVLLIAETNVYDPNMLLCTDKGGVGFDAEWCDDFLHSVFAVVRPGEQLCHRSYQPNDIEQTLQKGFVFQGSLRQQDQRVRASERVETGGLIYSIQHHDFIGNHPLGKRLHQLTSKETQRAAAALLLLSPGIPMLFMGEEFCCENPFQFFVDFGDDWLRQCVVDGRKREYPQHDWSAGVLPTDPEAFIESKIGPVEDGDPEMWAWYQSLIGLRKQLLQQRVLNDENLTVESDCENGLFAFHYKTDDDRLDVYVRLSSQTDAAEISVDADPANLVLNSLKKTDAGRLSANHAQVFRI